MTIRRVNTWACDRCKAALELLPTEQPREWAGVLVCTPALSVPGDETRKHLCGDCAHDLREFLAGKVTIPAFPRPFTGRPKPRGIV